MPATVDTAAHEVKVEGDNILVRLCEPGELGKTVEWRQPGQSVLSQAAPAIAAPGQAPEHDSRTPQPAQASEPGLPVAAAGQISEDLVREELKKVVDPELFINIVDLGLIYNVDLIPADEGKIKCKIDMGEVVWPGKE